MEGAVTVLWQDERRRSARDRAERALQRLQEQLETLRVELNRDLDGREHGGRLAGDRVVGRAMIKGASRHFCRPLSSHSFVRAAPRAFFRLDCIFPSPSRAAGSRSVLLQPINRNSAVASGSSFFNGWRSTPGTAPLTSQLVLLISTTTTKVEIGSNAVRDH
jgi:hypothetical protein